MEPEKDLSWSSQKLLWLQGLVYTLFFSLFALSKHRAPRHSQPPQHNPNDARNRSENISSGPVRVIVESLPPPPPPSDEHKAEKKRNKRFQWGKLILETLALFGLFLYVRETHRTNNLTEQALSDARKNFARDQRPYVWIAGMVPCPVIPQKRLCADVHFVNYGKSPAINEAAIGKIFIGDDAMAQADAWFAERKDKRFSHPTSQTIIPPGIPPDPLKAPNILTVASDTAPTKEELDRASKIDFGEVVVVHVEYYDTEGNFYRSEICSGRLATGAAADCKQNEIK